MECIVDGCENKSQKSGGGMRGLMCWSHAEHYKKCPPYLKQDEEERYVRGKCVVVGCERKQEANGKHEGRRVYRKLCSAHRDAGRGRRKAPLAFRRQTADTMLTLPQKVNHGKWLASLNTNECEVCGWEGPCDKHRIKPACEGGKYHTGNVLVVCPNCHRLIHGGIMRIKEGVAS